MDDLHVYSDTYNLPYPAVDAMVAEMLEAYVSSPPIPLVVHWRALSAGSSLHMITDVAGNELLRARVRFLPEDNRMVTSVDLETKNIQTAATLTGLLIRIRQIIAQHRANLRYLDQQGVGLPQTKSTPQPPPPPRPGDKEAQRAILDWYGTHDPNASNKEIAVYCRASESTVKGWRTQHGMPKRNKKEVP